MWTSSSLLQNIGLEARPPTATAPAAAVVAAGPRGGHLTERSTVHSETRSENMFKRLMDEKLLQLPSQGPIGGGITRRLQVQTTPQALPTAATHRCCRR